MLAFFAAPAEAHAATGLDGVKLPWPWALPFIGLLLSIAIMPVMTPRLWRAHYGKVAFAWSALTLAPLAALYGVPIAIAALVNAALGQYLSFIVMLLALYTVAGGILVTGRLPGTPPVNTALLLLGTALASVIGTTGAAMILIRPLLRANGARLHNVHVMVFFIFLVANIGGALSPLGNPPLFIGFEHGVDFFWSTTHLWRPTAVTAALVLAIFLVIDVWLYRHDRRITVVGELPLRQPIRVRGFVNILFVPLIVGAIFISLVWRSGVMFNVYGTELELQDIVRDTLLVVIAIASVLFTPEEHRESNDFSWEPIVEVAKLFAGIFVAIVPVLNMLAAGTDGPLAWVLALMNGPGGEPRNTAYFWATGILSAVLDNAPTYLVFFELAGGDATKLMGSSAPTLAAISMGAVYMGALTYIGNAPNLMVHAIATERGVKMPSFFGYLAWSFAILVPVFVAITFIFVIGQP
jgi:Na+/H+ antiporter NhaD/arsenite permease-like protein